MRTIKKYNTEYKKKVDVWRDTYLTRMSPREAIQCAGCGAFYHRRRWTLEPPAKFSRSRHTQAIFCPTCMKTRHRFPGGEVHLIGLQAVERDEVARILRNEERRARAKNPLERIMALHESNGRWKIETTTEKLAQRLGRSLKKARGGKLVYKWGHNNKFARVIWTKTAGVGSRC
ncbi:MAG TPA: BCAM0308 family protein [Candidatus Eisenbacteria bacterium]|nr:BCAM0308 family protein [Candidatus Eisenbacteria bacterium]